MEPYRRASVKSPYHKNRHRGTAKGAPRLPVDFLSRIDRAGYAQRMDDTIPNEGLVALQMVRDIETVYMFSDDNTTHESYLRHTESGDLAVFDVVGVAVETRLPPITDEKWRSIRDYPASAVQCVRLWGCGSGVSGDLLNGIDNVYKYACEHYDMEPLDIIGEYSSINPSINFGPTIKLTRKLLSEAGCTEPRANVEDPIDILGIVENSTGLQYTIANKIVAFDRCTVRDQQGGSYSRIQETNIDRVQLGQLVTAAVSFKVRSINHRGETKRGKLYAELHTVIIEGREACRDETGPKRFQGRRERLSGEQGNPL